MCIRDSYNFYPIQPSLNYGFAKVTQPWQTPAGAPAVQKTIEGVKDIIRFWLKKGVDGFRVDMAFSLVKDDGPGRPETLKVWQQIFPDIYREFPEAAFVSEWGVPSESIPDVYKRQGYKRMPLTMASSSATPRIRYLSQKWPMSLGTGGMSA